MTPTRPFDKYDDYTHEMAKITTRITFVTSFIYMCVVQIAWCLKEKKQADRVHKGPKGTLWSIRNNGLRAATAPYDEQQAACGIPWL